MLSRRLWLYRRPALFRMAVWGGFARARIEWLRIKSTVRLRSYWRLLRTLERGSIQASPNPLTGAPGTRILARPRSRGDRRGSLMWRFESGRRTGLCLPSWRLRRREDHWRVGPGRRLVLFAGRLGWPAADAANTLDVARVAIRKRRPGNAGIGTIRRKELA